MMRKTIGLILSLIFIIFLSGCTSTTTPTNNTGLIKCSINLNCGGGYKYMTSEQCAASTCCQIGSNWYLYNSKLECSNAQTEWSQTLINNLGSIKPYQSGHDAGYEWAEENDITSIYDCGGNSTSFIEGCEQYVCDMAIFDSYYECY